MEMEEEEDEEDEEEEEEEEEEVMGHSEGEKRPRGKETKELEKDVYTFPGDSDPESPPPAPWAHCTFIQRCRKKRVLLRPFSGLGTLKRTSSPQRSQSTETAQLDRGEGVYDFEEAGFGEAAVEEPMKLRERGGKGDEDEEEEEEEVEEEPGEEIFTCVECSIYFKKQVHLQEHIVEHCLSGAAGGRSSGKGGQFRCVECGWDLPNRLALADHHKRHQESRLKILAEIEKLNENGKARGIQKFDGKTVKHTSSDAAVMRDAGKTSDPEMADPPSPGPPPFSLACGHCAFLTSSHTVMREHQKLVHPAQVSISGVLADETGQRLRSHVGAQIPKPCLDSDYELQVEKDGKVLLLRRSNRVPAAPAETDSEEEDEDEDDIDEEHVRHLLSEGFLDEDPDGIDEDSEALKCVERKCPYCPDRFHNGIGLANHVRGHLNRVGVSYNVRHFISPEEVNAIERKFSYQKKKKKVANFDPDTFSVMHCEFCSAGFDTRAGLSSHARAHLRDFGITNWDVTISPIHILRELFSSRPDLAIPTAPPRSTVQLAGRYFDPQCAVCGAQFETRRGLSSHARSHLRQLGVSVSESSGAPIDLLLPNCQEETPLPARCSSTATRSEPPKEIGCEFCGEYFENRKGLSSHWTVNGSPIDTLREIITRRGLPCALPLKPLKPPPPLALPTFASGLILKLKPEPVQLEVTTPGAAGRSASISGEALNCSWSTMAHEMEPTRDIRCEFCGEYFENRKGLSSHARSHLRQMGITEWIVNGSPIDTLREVMHKRGVGPSSHQGVKKETSQGASSPLWENTEGLGVSGYQSKFRKSPLSLLQSGSRLHKQGLGSTSTNPPAGKFFRLSPLGKRPLSEEAQPVETANSPCELCGFFFENRKALASHARAHLRQFGVTEWCVNGSPIETLSAWMRSRPQKVLEMHRSYMQGNRTTLKKVSRGNALLEVLANHPKAGSTPGCSQQGGGTADPDWGHRGSAGRLWGGFTNIPDGTESPPKPPRTGTIPALVPKPPSYPLVKLVGKFYTLKCRFCEVEFHGPLSVQEDWIRHLQQHILKMNYNKARIVSPPKSPQAPFEAAFWTVTKSCYQGNEALLAYPLQQVW
uniref:Si:ch211-194b1.1 n=1 Tax=Cyclopterus lumpus TaxID=8103 RepID=A0A8C3APS5_CYCLU